MQIFFDDEQFHRELRGGVSRYICDLSSAIVREQQVPVTIFGGWSRSQAIRHVPPAPGLTIHHLARDLDWSIASFALRVSTPWRRWCFLQALRRDRDTVYHPNLYTPDPWIVRRAAATICTVYDMQIEVEGSDGRHARRQRQAKVDLVGQAERIVCISDNTRRDVERLIPAAIGKTRVVYLDSNIVRRPAASRAAPFFLFVGNRHGYKNGRAVLEAFAQVARESAELRLVLCGGRPPGEGGEFDGLDADFLRSRIDWSRPDDDELASLYAAALAVVYPSDYEGFGLPVLEAMRCGCPVITTSASSIPEVAGEAAAYFAPRDFAAMAQWMRRLLAEPALREDLIRRGLQQAGRFSWAATAAGFVSVAREALQSRRQAGGR